MSVTSEPTAAPVTASEAPKPALEPSPSAAESNTVSPAAQELANTLASSPNPNAPPLGNTSGQPELGAALGVELATRVQQALGGAVPEELQRELAALVMLIPDTVDRLDSEQLQMLRSAVRALLGEKPNYTYARELKGLLQRSVSDKKSPLRLSLWQKESPAILVVLGLGLFAYFAAPLALFVMPRMLRWGGRTSVLSMMIEDLVLITIVGALGSVTSIMVRIQDFDTETARYANKPGILVLYGFFKPLIGMFFALFCFALLNAGLLPAVVLPEGKQTYFFITIAFLAGFSERFARDLLSQVEKRTSLDVPTSPNEKK
jgi:hypothetical protein